MAFLSMASLSMAAPWPPRCWEAHAQQMGAANDAIMGETPASGTPFDLQELVTQEASSLHEYRKGKIATFVDEIYQDWIIPYIVREISKGIAWVKINAPY